MPAEFAVVLSTGERGAFTQTGAGAYRYEDSAGTHEFEFAAGFRYHGPAGTIEI